MIGCSGCGVVAFGGGVPDRGTWKPCVVDGGSLVGGVDCALVDLAGNAGNSVAEGGSGRIGSCESSILEMSVFGAPLERLSHLWVNEG